MFRSRTYTPYHICDNPLILRFKFFICFCTFGSLATLLSKAARITSARPLNALLCFVFALKLFLHFIFLRTGIVVCTDGSTLCVIDKAKARSKYPFSRLVLCCCLSVGLVGKACALGVEKINTRVCVYYWAPIVYGKNPRHTGKGMDKLTAHSTLTFIVNAEFCLHYRLTLEPSSSGCGSFFFGGIRI